jgi:glycosyltransferase involved in cell wall biosynthesis
MIVASSGEAFGLVVLEAYKFGVPVAIFKDGGGMIEIVNQVDPELVLDNEKSLTELLSNWTNLVSKYHLDFLANKRKEIVKSFSIEKTSLEFEKTYNEILCAV